MNAGDNLSAFEKEAIRLSLVRMFRPSGWFDICTIDTAARLIGIVIPRNTYEALRLLHCVHWNEMSQEMRQETAKTVLSIFEQPVAFDLQALGESFFPKQPQIEGEKKQGLLKRIFS